MKIKEKYEIEIKRAEIIIKYINLYFDVDSRIKTNARKFCLPRQIAQYFIYYYTKLPNRLNAGLFQKDHACVNNSVKAVKNYYATDKEFRELLDYLEKNIIPKISITKSYKQKELDLKKDIEKELENRSLIYLYKLKNNIKKDKSFAY